MEPVEKEDRVALLGQRAFLPRGKLLFDPRRGAHRTVAVENPVVVNRSR
jgi:hypothetical protein